MNQAIRDLDLIQQPRDNHHTMWQGEAKKGNTISDSMDYFLRLFATSQDFGPRRELSKDGWILIISTLVSPFSNEQREMHHIAFAT